MKDGNEIHVPYLSPKMILQKADEFRDKYWDDTLPVDIERIIDVKMGMAVIPVPGLYSLLGIKAYISSNWQEIMVDKQAYENEKHRLALAFSYAHEIGHLVLHKDIYNDLKIENQLDYYCFTEAKSSETCNFHRNAEIQANMFASFLMAPPNQLRQAKEKILLEKQADLKELGGLDEELLNEYLAMELSEKFGISDVALMNSLNNLGKL